MRSRPALRIDRPDELAAVAVGALVLSKVRAFGQTRVLARALEDLIERATADLSSEEVMNLEVEAYAVLDWLADGPERDDTDRDRIARRAGDVILYDPSAPIPDLIARAIDERFDLLIDYFSRRRGEMNTRRITPTSIDAETYVRAWCHARGAERVFRLNRVTRCVPVLGRPIEVPQRAARGESESGGPAQISLLDD